MFFRHCCTSVLSVAAILLAAVLLFVPAAQAQKRGGTLIYMVPASDPPSLDGHRETTFATIQPTAPFYSLLIQVNPLSKGGKELNGDLATSWTTSPDGRTVTFKLRSGVQFHDGSPLTSKDVKASFDKIIYPPEGVLSPRKAHFDMVDSISAPDDSTVVFQLKFPSGAFLPAVAGPYNYIYPAHILAQDPHWFEKNVLGSGPFKFVTYTAGERVVGVRNENYYVSGRPFLDGFEAIFAPKETVQVQAIRGGRAHAQFRGFPPQVRDDMTRAMGSGVTVQESTWNCNLIAVPNPHVKPFDDVRVRRAMDLAIDRWGGSKYLSRIAIVKTAGGAVFPESELAPSTTQMESLPGFSTDLEGSRAQARKLLAEAGYPNGFSFVLSNRNTDQPYKFVGTWLIDQWRQIGLTVTQEVLTTPALYDKLRGDPPAFQVSMAFNCQAIVNPVLDVSAFVSYPRSEQNYGKYRDAQLDAIYDELLREGDVKKQKALMWKYQQRISDQAWVFPTLWWQRTIAHSSHMKYWEITPSHYLNMGLAQVYLD